MTLWLNRFWLLFNIADSNTLFGFKLFIGLCLLVLALRIIVFCFYSGQLMVFSYYSKEGLTKDKLDKINRGLIGKMSREFVDAGRKGQAYIDTRAIGEKYINRLSLFGWSFRSIERFVGSFEASVLWVGLIFTLMVDDKITMGLFSVGLFLALKLLSSMFSVEQHRERLINESVCYINKEIGRFFTPDLTAAMNLLRSELRTSLDYFTTSFTGALTILKESFDGHSGEIIKLSDVISASDKRVETYSQTILEQADRLSSLLTTTEGLIDNLRRNGEALNSKNNVITEELKYLQINQQALSESLTGYELSLKDITTKMGEAMGKIVEFQLQRSHESLNQELLSGAKRINQANEDLLKRLGGLFDDLKIQLSAQGNAIINLQEQVELSFNALDRAQSEDNEI